MFTNPGGKLKTYAKVVFWVGAICSVILGLSIMSIGGSCVFIGLLVAVLCIFLSWLSVISLYATGVLVENSDELVRINGGQPSGGKPAAKLEVPKNAQQFVQEVSPVSVDNTAATPVAPMNANAKVCPSCGAQLNPEAKFCKNCGTKVD